MNVIANTHYVILNVVKNLKVSETVDGSANLKILRCAQDDKVLRGDASLSLSMTKHYEGVDDTIRSHSEHSQ